MDLTTKAAYRRPNFKCVTLPTGDTAYIRVLSGMERDAFNQWVKTEQASPEPTPDLMVYATFLVKALCDFSGARIYGDADAAELNADADAKTLATLFDAAMEWNSIGPAAVDASKNA